MDSLCGIYCVENMVNNKRYIGQSVDLKSRLYHHKSNLKNNKHKNRHLQFAVDKYGIDNFKFYIIEECSVECLDERERYYISLYRSDNEDFGYNVEPGGARGLKTMSDGTKSKISAALKGRKFTQGHRQKIGEANHNRIISEETRKRMSVHHQNMAGANNPMFGKRHSEETKKKISEANKNPSDETRKKISEASKGRVCSEETKKKISDAVSGPKHPRCRPVYCPELGEEFWGAKGVEYKYGIRACYITACLSGDQKSAGKHPVTGEKLTWQYKIIE